MDPDWDIQQAITASLQLFPTIPSLLHVKGHQDRFTAVTNLPLPAQLNVTADSLAGLYEYPPTVSSTVAPLIAGATALLHGHAGTINSNYRNTLWRLASDAPLHAYICSQNHWTDLMFELVSWEAQGIAVHANFSCQHFVTKWIHNWLPLGFLKSKYATHYSSSCPSCPCDVMEDRDHFLRCPSQVHWKGPFFEELRSFWLQKLVDPDLQFILSEALHSWLSTTPVSLPSLPARFNFLISHQSLIGWDQLFFGRFAKLWISSQDDFLKRDGHTTPRVSGRRFVTGTINIILSHLHSQWLQRNQDVHCCNHQSREIAELQQARQEIQHLYTFKPYVCPDNRILFYDTPKDHFQAEPTATALRSWINTWGPVILSSSTLPR